MSLRNIMTLITLGVLLQGIFALKDYLMENFVDNNTPIKRQLNHFLNGNSQSSKDVGQKIQ